MRGDTIYKRPTKNIRMDCIHKMVILAIYALFGIIAIDAMYANEYHYAVERDRLKQEERKYAGYESSLNEDETIVNHYMQFLKWQEYNYTRDTFVPLRPIEETYHHIIKTKLFATLKKLPKGGNMHIHEHHVLEKKQMLELAMNLSDWDHLYVTHPNQSASPWQYNFFINPPPNKGWVKFKDHFKVDDVIHFTHLMGILDARAKSYPSDTGYRWKLAGGLFGRLGGDFLANENIQFRYLEALFDAAREENVQYLEGRRSIYGRLYRLNSNGSYADRNGQQLLDTDGSYEIAETIKFINNYTARHPEFFGLKNIIYHTRSNPSRVRSGVKAYTELYKKFPELIRGLDMVGEEDKGYTLLFYLEDFIKNYDPEAKRNKMPFYFHTAETNWPADLQPNELNKPFDPVSTIDNAYESVMLDSQRIGHGLGFEKHPYLLKLLRERGTAIEVCPASNQILGYVPDIRLHPAVHFLRAGVPIVLGGDDPGTFGYNYFTVDWYLAYMAWGLDLNDMKQLAINSLNYSALTTDEKTKAINDVWTPAWSKFIADMKIEACGAKLDTYKPIFARILPREGALNGETKVHIFGRHFERGTCKTLKCKFGDIETEAKMISPTQLHCKSAVINHNSEMKVNVSISFDNGATYMPTGETFTYKYAIYTPSITTTMGPHSSGPYNYNFSWLLAFLIASLL
ncbi:unnamed protein product [Owenia fusiformis]|uniref:Uncharacterized protein n=1 Tax=Owenia fusiformis TaxID=6347 RepID=A0A8J1T6Q4_OWEFU|nr:unnamed protein product [Owenia fusiformis]